MNGNVSGKGADVIKKSINEKFCQKKMSESQTKAGNPEKLKKFENLKT